MAASQVVLIAYAAWLTEQFGLALGVIGALAIALGVGELMPKTIANATIDRLLHHAHIVLTAGDSIRLTQATAGKGVTPLTN